MKRVFSMLSAILMVFFVSLPAFAGNTLKIGTLPAADSLILHIAKQDGCFTKVGLDVEIVPFQSALELGAAMRAGNLDGHFGDIINVLMQNENGVPQTIIATTSHSEKSARFFGIAVSPKSKINSIGDLPGKNCSIGRATIVEFVLDTLVARNGVKNLEKKDIRQIPVRLQMLMSGQTDAALLPEPLLSLVEAQGAKILLDDREMDLPLAVIALRRGEDAQAFKATAEKFRMALADAAGKINADPEKYKKTMIDLKLLNPKAATKYAMLRFNAEFTPLSVPRQADMESYAAWMKENGILKKAMPDYKEIVFCAE